MRNSERDSWEIEPIDTESVPAVSQFFHDRLNDTFSESFPPEAIRVYRRDYRAEALLDEVAAGDRVLLKATENKEIGGVMFGGPPEGGLAYVVWVVVHPDKRGEGLGRRLMEETFAQYRKMGVHKVALYTETLEARGFYESVGMELEGTHPDHWWGVDHFCLARKFQSYNSSRQDTGTHKSSKNETHNLNE